MRQIQCVVCLIIDKEILRLQRYICLHEGYRAYAGHAAACPALHNMARCIILAERPVHNFARSSVCCAGLLPTLTLQILPEACINDKMSVQQSRCWQVWSPDHECFHHACCAGSNCVSDWVLYFQYMCSLVFYVVYTMITKIQCLHELLL